MIYNKIDFIPYKTFMEIMETDNISLLSTEPVDEAELRPIWEKLRMDFLSMSPSNEDDKVLKIQKEIEYFECKYKQVLTICRALRFDYWQEGLDELREMGFNVHDETYLDELDRVEREANGILVRADKFRSNLPKTDPDKPKSSIDDMLACYGSILGIDFDYNTVSVTKVVALGKQVEIKIKQFEKVNANG